MATASIKKMVMVACITGFAISGTGIGLVALGGWGPCGPGSAIATMGGYLTMTPVAWLVAIVPSVEAISGRLHADFVLVFVWPALIWSLVTFVALISWKKPHT